VLLEVLTRGVMLLKAGSDRGHLVESRAEAGQDDSLSLREVTRVLGEEGGQLVQGEVYENTSAFHEFRGKACRGSEPACEGVAERGSEFLPKRECEPGCAMVVPRDARPMRGRRM